MVMMMMMLLIKKERGLQKQTSTPFYHHPLRRKPVGGEEECLGSNHVRLKTGILWVQQREFRYAAKDSPRRTPSRQFGTSPLRMMLHLPCSPVLEEKAV